MNQYARIHLLITIVLAVAILIVFGQLFFIAFLLPWVAVTIISSRYPINQATNILVIIISVLVTVVLFWFLLSPTLSGDSTVNIGGGMVLIISSISMTMLGFCYILVGLDRAAKEVKNK
tara:strand:+ start:109 stop:465 length:357 start_codon:yes stop_codon:yes gene_type:complete